MTSSQGRRSRPERLLACSINSLPKAACLSATSEGGFVGGDDIFLAGVERGQAMGRVAVVLKGGALAPLADSELAHAKALRLFSLGEPAGSVSAWLAFSSKLISMSTPRSYRFLVDI